ncbi:hypothetical protein [Burkholderia pseudomallei]|uniref:hypothetical protein n=1 Tax=Burkholderia pseudomallei TaxID=28450 RepID=UPI00048D9EDC|nr:hypothetical protein [Burkholderia pseudomallei]AJX96921.1 hypothetical protein BG24_699 [Burkholderia pseudomallei PB08298010]
MSRTHHQSTAVVPTADVVLSLRLPAGTAPAIVSSLKHGLEDLVAIVLTQAPFDEAMIKRADDLATAIAGLPEPAVTLIGERIQRQKSIRAIFARGDWLTAGQINVLQAAPPSNEAQPASDWKRCGDIFSVFFRGEEYFAGYQFDASGQPLPIIKEILNALGPVDDPWRIAAWFHFQNGWISGSGAREGEPVSPMDALDRRDALLNAARHMHGTYVA